MRWFWKSKPASVAESSAEERLIAALGASHGIAWFSRDGKLLRANDLFCDLVGVAAADVIGLTHGDIVQSTVDGQPADALFSQARSGERHAPDCILCRAAEGEKRWIEAFYVVQKGVAGGPDQFVMVATRETESSRRQRDVVQDHDALAASKAKITFDLEGNILDANDLFLQATGYALDEIRGKHHSIFVHPEYKASPKYREFWQRVAGGKVQTGLYKRFGKTGNPIWLEATYTVVRNAAGDAVRVVKFATDVTERETSKDLGAIMSSVQAVIEFKLDGTILNANENFCTAIGYSLAEIKGRHHRMFMPDGEADKPEYAEHWRRLAAGDFHFGEYRRRRKDGSDIWISASYSPIFDPDGNPVKVVKYATDITPRVVAVNRLRDALARLASGDLTTTIDFAFSADFEGVRLDFNRAVQGLQRSMVKLAQSSSEIGAGTQELSKASDDLSRRTESQAASLAQTAAAITEMASSVRSTSDIAGSTRELVGKTQARATSGAAVMAKARGAMTGIASSSGEISKITSLIEDIAFQTNLLALNAGVEAARAGDAGRGFAVVASEVRALAQRSSEAATEIARLIQTSVTQVDQGVDLVSRTSEALSEIQTYVTEVAQMVETIATAAREQSGGIEEIRSAIGELDDVTQKNAAMFEETTAATQVLAKEVVVLGEIASAFRLDAGSATEAGGYRRAS